MEQTDQHVIKRKTKLISCIFYLAGFFLFLFHFAEPDGVGNEVAIKARSPDLQKLTLRTDLPSVFVPFSLNADRWTKWRGRHRSWTQ